MSDGPRRLAPTFFVIGEPRAGTTSLHHYLGQHPAVCMSRRKEPNHFLGPTWPVPRVEDPEAYAALFEAGPTATIAGEASPEYLYDAHARARIAAGIPGARALVVLRHPVERAFSEWVYLRVRGIEPARTFEQAFTEDHEGRRADAPRFLRPWRSGCVADDLAAWAQALGRERLHVLLFEDLARDPHGTLAGVLRFLGVDPQVPLDLGRQHNAAWTWRADWLAGWLGTGRRRRRVLERLFPGRLVERLARSGLVRRRPRLDPRTRARLAPLFLADARRASGWAGVDLAARWGLVEEPPRS